MRTNISLLLIIANLLQIVLTGGCTIAHDDPSPQIEKLLVEMENAARQANCDVYIRFIAREPEHFFQQEKHWCENLKANPLTDFHLQVEDLHSEADGRFIGRMTKTWRSGEDTPSQQTTYEAVFIPDETGKFRYGGPNFSMLGNDLLQIYYFPGQENMAQALLETLTPIYPRLMSEIDYFSNSPASIELYPDPQIMIGSIGIFLPIVAGGYTAPGEAIKIVTTNLQQQAGNTEEAARQDMDQKDLVKTLAHELGHHLIHEMAGGASAYALGGTARQIPVWLDEGMAEWVSDPYRVDDEDFHIKWMKMIFEEGLTPLNQLSDFQNMAEENYWKVYEEGYSMVRYITDHFGQKKRNAWIRAIASGSDLNSATLSELGVSFPQIEIEWKNFTQKEVGK